YSSRFRADYSMVRVKVPGGVMTPEQVEKLADVSEKFSIGSAHVSTRQNIQLHWVNLDDVPEALKSLHEVDLTSREACGNTIRNIMCSPIAGVCPYETFDATPYTRALAKYLMRNPLNQALPRKFKINFSCCENHGLAKIGDIGVVPLTRKGNGQESQKGFKLYFGGGLGPASFIAEPVEEFTGEEEFLVTCIAIIRLFDRHGDRGKMHMNRMRYLVQKLGFQPFREMILKERSIIKATSPSDLRLEVPEASQPTFDVGEQPELQQIEDSVDEEYSRWRLTNLLPQKQAGYYLVFVTLPAGDISADQLRGIAGITEKYSRERNLRASLTQNIIVRWVEENDVRSVYDELGEIGLSKPGGLTIASPIGCSGTTSCNLALTNSHRMGKEIQNKILALGLDKDEGLKDATIKISGCPNSCGQHEIATLGFFGGGMRFNGAQAPAYTMLIGGGVNGEARLGETVTRIPAKKVIDVISTIIDMYRKERSPKETLPDWIQKIVAGTGTGKAKTVEDLKKVIDELATMPSLEEDPDAYADWGSDNKYHTKTAKGECAA
ncbi:MAG: nitrite/sulfite reductase, partial [Candidatus Geothermarchaeales archaeon]